MATGHTRPRWHTCHHPYTHTLTIIAILGGWLFGTLRVGLPWVLRQCQSPDPLLHGLLAILSGGVWVLYVVPYGCGFFYEWARSHCGSHGQTPGTPPPHVSGHRVTERMVFPPDAAAQAFGVQGTVIIEREYEE